MRRRDFCADACRAACLAAFAAHPAACGGGGPAGPLTPVAPSPPPDSTPAPTPAPSPAPAPEQPGFPTPPSVSEIMPIPLVPASVDQRTVVVMVGADSPIAVTRGVARVSFERDSNPWDILLVRTGERSFTALSAVCTHFGCLVTMMMAGPIFVCACHGSRYGHEGEVVRGPANAPLRQWPTRYVDGTLTVTL